jgi:hypothetical protein
MSRAEANRLRHLVETPVIAHLREPTSMAMTGAWTNSLIHSQAR